MNVCGIDYSSKAVHLVLLDLDTNHATDHEWHLDQRLTVLERARQLARKLPRASWWEDNGVCLIGMEDPYSQFPKEAKAMGIIAGALAVLLPPEVPIVQTPPGEWKKLLTGNGNASKEVVRFHALAHWLNPPSGPDVAQDTFDAFGVSFAVRHLNEEAVKRGVAA